MYPCSLCVYARMIWLSSDENVISLRSLWAGLISNMVIAWCLSVASCPNAHRTTLPSIRVLFSWVNVERLAAIASLLECFAAAMAVDSTSSNENKTISCSVKTKILMHSSCNAASTQHDIMVTAQNLVDKMPWYESRQGWLSDHVMYRIDYKETSKFDSIYE